MLINFFSKNLKIIIIFLNYNVAISIFPPITVVTSFNINKRVLCLSPLYRVLCCFMYACLASLLFIFVFEFLEFV